MGSAKGTEEDWARSRSIENGSDVFGNGYAEGESYPSVSVSVSSAAPLTARGRAVFSKTTTLSRSLSAKWTLLIDGVGGSDLERVWTGSWPIAGDEMDDLREDLRGFPFESTTGVEGVLEMGERDSLGVELRLFLEGESAKYLFSKSVTRRVVDTNRDGNGNGKRVFGWRMSFCVVKRLG